MTTDTIYRAFYDDNIACAFLHSHTHAGNALACRAALATLDIFEQDNVLETNRAKTAYLNHAARPIASHPRVKSFRNCGMIWAFEVETADPAFAGKFSQAALTQELSLRPLDNTVYFMPPYIIDQPEMDLLVAGTLRALESC
jgi:adenosylmethionine-8-amino-7-oxononanoate aminotransferase